MDVSSPTASKLIFVIQNARGIAQHASASQFTKDLRLSVSTLLTLPMLSSGLPQVRLIALSLLFLVISALALSYLFLDSITTSPNFNEISVPAIRSLSKFLIPTSSIWPESYLSIARSAEQLPRGKYILLRPQTIFRDIKQGRIELRNPSNDLPLLIKGQLQMDGWSFKLDLSLKDKAKIWAWTISDELSFFPDEAFPKPCTFAEGKIPCVDRTVLTHYCALFYEVNDNIIIWPSLDTVPRAFIQKFIRNIQGALKTKPVTNSTSVFSFTTAEAGLSTFDDAFLYAALPFSGVHTKDLKDTRQRASLRLRSSAPLFTRLSDILALLTSGPHALRVLTVSNASAPYANALDAHATALEYDDSVRRECIKVGGVQGWREERLYAQWEAALLRAGILTRWVALLEVKE